MALGYNAFIPLAFGTGGVTLPPGGTNGDFLVKTSIGLGWASINSANILDKSGDTMTGLLILSGNPVDPNGAVTKAFAEGLVNTLDADLQPQITAIDGRVATNEGDISALQTTVGTNSTDISTLQTTVSGNSTDISTLQTTTSNNISNISNNTSDISTLQTSVGTNATNISTNASNITTLQTNVGTNTADISTLQTNVSTNTSDISTLETTVAGNVTDISTFQTNVGTNTTGISTLNSTVSGIETDLGTLETTVAGNITDISTLQTSVSINTSGISTNASAITSLQGSVSQNVLDIGDLETATGANALAITNLGSTVAGITSDIGGITSDITTINDTLAWKLDVVDFTLGNLGVTASPTVLNYCTGLTTGIQTQLDLITADITDLESNTNTLQTDVLDLDGRVGVNEADIITIESALAGKLDAADLTLGNLGVTATGTELDNTIGTTSNIQTQINTVTSNVSDKLNTADFTLPNLGVTATATELNYVDGVTSNIQAQLDSKAPTSPLFVIVRSLADLPSPVSGVVSLAANTTYFIVGNIDLAGNRLSAGLNVVIKGNSPFVSTIRSTGLSSGSFLTSTTALTIESVGFYSFGSVVKVLDISSNPAYPPITMTGTLFSACQNLGTITNASDVLINDTIFSDCAGLVFDGSVGSISANTILFKVAAGLTGITVSSSATVTRRLRIQHSAFETLLGSTGIDFSDSATAPSDSYIFNSVIFTGTGTMTEGVTHTSNKANFVNCSGVRNSATFGNMQMNNNTTSTPVAAANTFYKVVGTTTVGALNERFTHSSGRLTHTGAKSGYFKIETNISARTIHNAEFTFAVAKNGIVSTTGRTRLREDANSSFVPLTLMDVLELNTNDYIEIYVASSGSNDNIQIADFNVIITRVTM